LPSFGAESISSSLSSKDIKIKIYRTIILPVVFYGCETWSLTLRKEHRLRAFENRVLRRIFGPKRDEVTWEWKKLPKEEINEMYSSTNIIRVIKSRRKRQAGHVARIEDWKGAYMFLVRKSEGKRPLGRLRCRWEDRIKINLLEVDGGMDWIDLAQDRDMWRAFVKAVIILRVQ